MVSKNKNNTSSIYNLESVASHLGLAVMMLATVASISELPHREGGHSEAVLQPAYSATLQTHSDEQMRRGGKEEVRHTSASYGAVMRSHFVAGSL
jgi:hypothetical protein